MPAVRDWTFIVFRVAGRGLAAEVRRSLQALDRTPPGSRTGVCVRAEQDGRITDFSLQPDPRAGHHLRPMPGGLQRASTTSILSEAAVVDFISHAARAYPARHYFVCFEGHSEQIRPALPALHAALQKSPHVDVLAFDSCFMAQLEVAACFRDVADVLLASQEGVAGTRPVEQAVAHLERTRWPPDRLARWFVRHNQDLTFSVLDLKRLGPVVDAMRSVTRAIRRIGDPARLEELRHAVRRAQHFYTEGVAAPHPFHNTVDVDDVLHRLASATGASPGLRQACGDARRALRRLVVDERHQRDCLERTDALDYTQVVQAHGASVYWPTEPRGLRDEYTLVTAGPWDDETGWNRMLEHLSALRTPADAAAALSQYLSGALLSHLGTALEQVSLPAASPRP